MAQLQVTKTIAAPINDVWATWDAFGGVDQVNPNIRASYLVGGTKASDRGAEPRCEMPDGDAFTRERIVGYELPAWMVAEAIDDDLPIEHVRVVLDFAAVCPQETEVTATMTFAPKGVYGQLMAPFMKDKMVKTLERMLSGNEASANSGNGDLVAA